ncbi:MAG: electron transfer flavoprotein subunit beta/FixA family protein [Austwickia sp.]|jgi:electron transfer flavoprotein beta subunit|nr:electron transfer flavoprotein subunit beta/FixA family protein [Austwickia sp.]MBK8436906.1 electron transfer flavoprotein subunit beta/FixA family protein [Austwickia sp.]MBK9100533.1 electron transfer flavoprotein subunit beta/FixA family protein [Austwickia sp.]
MNIVVCVKYVPDAQSDRGFAADNTTDRDAVDGLMSELDEYAVEEALKIKEAGNADEVIAITMGPAKAAEAIKKALQMGADKGIHISDDALAGSCAVATSLVLAAAIRKLGEPGIVMTGMASTDGTGSVVPAMLAERLDLPQVTFASELEFDGQRAKIRRDGDVATEIIETQVPAVISVTDQINEPRYPSFKGIMAAKKKPVETWSLADIGVDAGQVGLANSWTAVDDTTKRPAREQGLIVTDDGEGGTVLAHFLTLQKFI